MKIKTALAALLIPMALVFAACGQQDGCYDDGERVSCNYDDDEREYDDDDRYEDDDDEGWDD